MIRLNRVMKRWSGRGICPQPGWPEVKHPAFLFTSQFYTMVGADWPPALLFKRASTLLAPSVSDAFPVHECAAIILRWSAQRRPARHPCRPCLVHSPLTNLVSFRHEQAGKADISKWSFDLNVGRDTLAGEAAPDPPGFSKQSHEGQVSSELVDPHFRRWWF
jgi:hypothetical protein